MADVLEGKVLNEGKPNCKHEKILYENNMFDGQAWWCDIHDCGRHEQLGYSPGDKIKFPSNTLISTPNPKYGGERFYAFRTNDKGEAKLLNKDEWVRRIVIGSLV